MKKSMLSLEIYERALCNMHNDFISLVEKINKISGGDETAYPDSIYDYILRAQDESAMVAQINALADTSELIKDNTLTISWYNMLTRERKELLTRLIQECEQEKNNNPVFYDKELVTLKKIKDLLKEKIK